MKTYQILLAFGILAAVTTAQEITVNRVGSERPQPGPTDNFTGSVRVDRIFGAESHAPISGGLVTFNPGARTAWHTHPLGQTLFVTEGTGRVQRWGGPIQEIRKGDTVRIPPNVKHWHGASSNSPMSHIAIAEQLEGKAVVWMEKVSDAEFNAPLEGQPAPAAPSGPSRAQVLVGDIAPKLAELTDTVLFGDVWARPQLARRDRSLATRWAKIAGDHPNQCRHGRGSVMRANLERTARRPDFHALPDRSLRIHRRTACLLTSGDLPRRQRTQSCRSWCGSTEGLSYSAAVQARTFRGISSPSKESL